MTALDVGGAKQRFCLAPVNTYSSIVDVAVNLADFAQGLAAGAESAAALPVGLVK
jgi:hypothetical protein